jgi:hypothetical protein
MPYIATDLDAFDDAQAIAGSTGLPFQHVLGGLACVWRWCWRQKTDRVSAEQVAALFGSTAPGLPAALVAFGFLEATEPYRVRGVDRYLRLSEVRRQAGKARAEKAKRDTKSGQLLSSNQPAHAGQPTSTTPAADQPLQRRSKVEGRKATKDLAGSADADPLAGTDATYKAMVSAMFVLFRDDRGFDLEPSGKDWKALQRLREKHEAAEIIRRWGNGVKARWKAKCSCFMDLEAKWNDCGAPEASQGPSKGVPDVTRGHVRAETQDALHGPAGEHEF